MGYYGLEPRLRGYRPAKSLDRWWGVPAGVS
jgi:hypothetical protein